MSLGLALLARNEADEVARILPHLGAVVPDSVPLFLIDAESSDATPRHMAAHAQQSHARRIALARPTCSPETAAQILRHKAGVSHALVLSASDRLVPGQLEKLAAFLAAQEADLTIIGGGWWLTDSALPFPDAPRIAKLGARPGLEDALALTPDPRRLLSGGADLPSADPFALPAEAWTLWQDSLRAARQIAVFPEPVVLRALPRPWPSAIPALAEAARRLSDGPRRDRAKVLARLAPWLGDALSLAPTVEAPLLASELRAFRARLPWTLRRRAAALASDAHGLFAALDRGEELAMLSLMATMRHDRILAALAEDLRGLRADVDLALPGPDYLADLYARVRAL